MEDLSKKYVREYNKRCVTPLDSIMSIVATASLDQEVFEELAIADPESLVSDENVSQNDNSEVQE